MEDSNVFECTADPKNVDNPNKKFGRADQKFGCLNPHHFLVGLTKNQGPLDQNFGQPNQIAVKPHSPP